jgi:hypothetical protein
LRQLIAEGGAPPDILLTLLSELPPKDDINTLLDVFFRDINPVRFPLPDRDIRRAFDELNAFTWGPAREDGDDGASHLIFLPLLFMIIATTTFCLPLAMSNRIDVKLQAKRYYHSCELQHYVAHYPHDLTRPRLFIQTGALPPLPRSFQQQRHLHTHTCSPLASLSSFELRAMPGLSLARPFVQPKLSAYTVMALVLACPLPRPNGDVAFGLICSIPTLVSA